MANQMTTVCWKLASITICLIGCLWQLNLICDQYFEYNVSTTVTIDTNPNMTPAGMAYCFESVHNLGIQIARLVWLSLGKQVIT